MLYLFPTNCIVTVKFTSLYLLSITNKMQRYTIFFITVNALHVSGGFSDHHQEHKNCKCNVIQYSLLLSLLYMFQGVSPTIIRSSKTVHTASSIFQACMLLPLACESFSSPTLITVNALHVSGGFSYHHQELKNCTHSIGYMSSLLAATASVGELQLTHAYYCQCSTCFRLFLRPSSGAQKLCL